MRSIPDDLSAPAARPPRRRARRRSHVEHEHVGGRAVRAARACRRVGGRTASRARRTVRPGGERRRTTSSWSLVHRHGTTVTVPRRGRRRVIGQRSDRTGRTWSRCVPGRRCAPARGPRTPTISSRRGTRTSCISCSTRSRASPRSRPPARTTSSRPNRRRGSRPGSRTRRRCARCASVAVFFEPAMVPGRGDRVRVLAAVAPIREMIVYATRWRIDRPVERPDRRRVLRPRSRSSPPSGSTPPKRRCASPPALARSIAGGDGVHAGAPRRRQRRRRVRRRRPLRALAPTPVPRRRRDELAAVPHSPVASCGRWRCSPRADRTVLDAAVEVGFDSLSGFNRAFLRLCGERRASTGDGSRVATDRTRGRRALRATPSARPPRSASLVRP